MKVGEARPRIAELLEAGDLQEVQVEGWREPAYSGAGERRSRAGARAIDACALLSPFDPLIWFRPRTKRLFDFDYRFEIFVPAPKRKWGSYVLPFLMGDRLVARVDVKSDRPNRRLLVPGAYLEPGADAERRGGGPRWRTSARWPPGSASTPSASAAAADSPRRSPPQFAIVGRGSCPGRSHLCSGDLRLSSLRADGKRPGHPRPTTPNHGFLYRMCAEACRLHPQRGARCRSAFAQSACSSPCSLLSASRPRTLLSRRRQDRPRKTWCP